MTKKEKPDFPVEMFLVADLHDHPDNYREHPDDQLEHIIQSIQENGFYRNVVVCNGNIILAGHGVVRAACKMGLESVPGYRLSLEPDDPRALKVLIGDNEISHLGEIDDRKLTEGLKKVMELDVSGLLGTGFDEMMLANLVYVTRGRDEIQDFDAAAHWTGMPEYESPDDPVKLIISFRDDKTRRKFVEQLGLEVNGVSAWWPPDERPFQSSATVLFKTELS